MATTYAQRKQLFDQLCDSTRARIRAEHEAFTSRVAGWFRHQWQRRVNARSGTVQAGMGIGAAGVVAGSVASYFVNQLPLVGPLIMRSVGTIASVARRKLLERGIEVADDPNERFHITGALLIEHGMQAYVDALRKVDQAAVDYAKTQVGNCEGFLERVYRFYYWKYRLERLQYYHALILEYCLKVDESLAEAERSWKEMERDLKLNGPKIYEDWTWHEHQCKECCIFPWETLEISAPIPARPPLPPRTHPKQLNLPKK
jgi:hypothetical protein